VKAYLSPEHCDHAEWGCPVAALASDLGRTDKAMKARIVAEIAKYRTRILPFMPGRRAADKESAFFAIYSTMIGAMAMARMLSSPEARAKVLGNARDFLLRSF
jgi:TetR/AcrR family transcriptional regulator, transcriptional repressor for nem operon